MANCANDLTSVDLEHLRNRDGAPSQLALGATRDDSLYSYVVLDQCSASNAADPDGVKRVIRPLDTKDVVRLNETAGFGASAELGEEGVPTGGCIETHLGDDELLMQIHFSELVKVKSVILNTGGGRLSASPRRCKIWVNRVAGVGFEEARELAAEQDFELRENEDGSRTRAVEYPVRLAKFSNVSELTLFFSDSVAGEQTRLFYLGFKGEARSPKKDPSQNISVGAEMTGDSAVDGTKADQKLPDLIR